jgi:hypothetical protein
MKLFLSILLLCLPTLSILLAQANCGDVAPRLSPNRINPTVIGFADSTTTPIITNLPTLPTIEYCITKPDSLSADSSGAMVITTNFTGVFAPQDYNINGCERFAVTAFSYDRSQVRRIVQAILTQNYVPNYSCCDYVSNFAANFCANLNAIGINDSSDVNTIADFVQFSQILLGSTSTYSIQNIVDQIELINVTVSILGNCNGGVTQICYAVDTLYPDFYIVQASAATGFSISPDTGTLIGLGNNYQFNAQLIPAGSCPLPIQWSLLDNANGNATIDANTGIIFGQGFDTLQVLAVNTQDTTMRDTATLIIRDVQANIHQNTAAALHARLYPNPASQLCYIEFTHPAAAEIANYEIIISDLNGRQLHYQKVEAINGQQQIPIHAIQNLAQGVYLLQLRHNSGSFIEKIVKI